MITIVDYGMGNLRSVQKGFARVGFEARITDRPEVVAGASRLVLPGVGAFGAAMSTLRDRGLIDAQVTVPAPDTDDAVLQAGQVSITLIDMRVLGQRV